MTSFVSSIIPPAVSTIAQNAAPVPPSRAEGATASQTTNANTQSAGQAAAKQAAVVVSLSQAASFTRAPSSGVAKQVDAAFEKQSSKDGSKKDGVGTKAEGRKGRVNVTA